MTGETSTIERAFAIAKGGTCRNMAELRIALKRERCERVEEHLAGKSLSAQLQRLMKSALAG